MANKVVTYTEPVVACIRSLNVAFDSVGAASAISYTILVESDNKDGAQELSSRLMSGSVDPVSLTKAESDALLVLCGAAHGRFIGVENF